MAGIGRDLLDIPFAEMVRNLALAIAEGQTALDRNSVQTLRELADTQIEVLTEVTEVIDPVSHTVSTDAGDIPVTGAEVTETGVRTGTLSMIQAGFLPTFYQFTDTELEVALSITMREDREDTTRSQQSSSGGETLGFFSRFGASRAYASSVDYRSANTYGYQAQGASRLRTRLKPVPPPGRIDPTVVTVNRLGAQPIVTRSPG